LNGRTIITLIGLSVVAADRCAYGDERSWSAVLVDRLQRRYEQTETVRVVVQQTVYFADLGTNDRVAGTLEYRRPGMLRWELPNEVYITQGDNLWIEKTEDRQVYAGSSKNGAWAKAFLFLTGTAQLTKVFKIAEPLPTERTELMQVVSDIDFDKSWLRLEDQETDAVYLLHLNADSWVDELVTQNPLGNWVRLQFRSIQVVKLSAKRFKPHLGKGIEVIPF